MDATAWRQVVGFEGYYEVSNDGQVRSVDRTLPPDSLGRVARRKGKLLKRLKDEGGYLRVVLSMKGRHRTYLIHRLVLETFEGPCPIGMECCHNDNNPANNCSDNLRWDTPKSNQADRIKNCTGAVGDRNGRAKLSNEQVTEIKRRLASGERQVDLTREYDVSKHIIWAIKKGKTWKGIGD